MSHKKSFGRVGAITATWRIHVGMKVPSGKARCQETVRTLRNILIDYGVRGRIHTVVVRLSPKYGVLVAVKKSEVVDVWKTSTLTEFGTGQGWDRRLYWCTQPYAKRAQEHDFSPSD